MNFTLVSQAVLVIKPANFSSHLQSAADSSPIGKGQLRTCTYSTSSVVITKHLTLPTLLTVNKYQLRKVFKLIFDNPDAIV